MARHRLAALGLVLLPTGGCRAPAAPEQITDCPAPRWPRRPSEGVLTPPPKLATTGGQRIWITRTEKGWGGVGLTPSPLAFSYEITAPGQAGLAEQVWGGLNLLASCLSR